VYPIPMAKNKKMHLRKEERFCIEKLLKQNKSFGEMSRTLNRGLSTISEEVNQNGGRKAYQALKADHRAYLKQYRKKKDCNKVAMNGDILRFVEKRLRQGWSPETIRDRIKERGGVEYTSAKSIRKYIKQRSGLEQLLFWGRNTMKSGKKRNKDSFIQDPDRKWIEMRPWNVFFSYGHWEADFIVSKHNTSVLLVLVEKWSKTISVEVLPNRTHAVIAEALKRLLFGRIVSSLTIDNDVGFSKWKELETLLRTQIYFCHPFHSWEKGLVENTNRWIREFIPKKSDLALYSKEYIQDIELWFNHTPRQCLNGKTSYEIMMKEERGKIISSVTEFNLPTLRI
jgi:transposase, IS30 family